MEKKSLISTLNTTKKAVVASSPAAGSTAPTAVKAGGHRFGAKSALAKKLATKGDFKHRPNHNETLLLS